MFLHTVFFWLKEDITTDETQRFKQSLATLTGIDGVTFGFIGTPASTRRPVIDATYSYKLVVGFDDINGHDSYQTDKVHLTFIRECSMLWTKVLVYDAEEIS